MLATPTAKDRFTSLDTLALARELRALDRARVDKVFDLEAGGWSVTFRAPGEGRRELVLVPGRYAALLAEPPAHAEGLSPLARELRRLLTGATLGAVLDPGGERFLELELGRAGEPAGLLLAIEIFGAGNLIVAREGRIAAVAYPRQWAHRAVRVGAEYVRPPRRPDPFGLDRPAIEAELARSRTDLASTLAARLALGGPIAEELVARGGFNPDEPAARDPARVGERLHRDLAALLAEVGETPHGYLYVREGHSVDATPYRSLRWAPFGVAVEERPTFSEAAQEFFVSLAPARVGPAEAEAAQLRRDLERLVDQQRRAVEQLSTAVEDLQAQAEAVYAHYAEAEAAVAVARSGTAPERRVEVDLDGTRVSLRVDRPPRATAQELFDEAKRVGAKLAGARAALQESERRLAEPARPAGPAGAPGPAAAPARRSRHWFEQYRWFVSSEGAIVVAGRDASSNDQVVKRHLKEGDFYVHADMHGSASVVVKHPPSGAPAVSDVTLREAAQFAVAFSKAWRAGLASAEAFWVTPDQVTKSGGSGEFVARGAWVIHGTKHVVADVPLELAVGTVVYDRDTLWTVAPPEAVRRRGTARFLLTPGPERERADREVELARELGVPRTLLQALLPAGGISVRRA